MAGVTANLARLLVLLLAAFCRGNAEGGNMNGRYLVASGARQAVPFNDDYASKGHKYFDVWSPELATHYGEVFWTDQGNIPIPAEIIKKFDGKVMAITGYEQDQVMVNPVGKPGLNPDQDVSVPINWAYNHHYIAWMTGKHSMMKKIPNPNPNDISAHGSPMKWMAVAKPSTGERVDLKIPISQMLSEGNGGESMKSFHGYPDGLAKKWMAVSKPSSGKRVDPKIPISQMFSEGNGGESRKSFHGYPDGFAQLIESPDSWHITPMQIDTRNRDCGATAKDVNNCTTFIPGPEPKQARYGLGHDKHPMYSGILECPCNGRYGGDPAIYGADTKTKIITHHFACVSQPTCSDKIIKTATECFNSAAVLGITATKNVTVSSVSNSIPQGCSTKSAPDGSWTVTYNKFISPAKCSASGSRLGNASFSTGVHAHVKLSTTEATITIAGPADAWFGIGFNALYMTDSPYTIVTNSSGVFEQQIGTCGSEAEHCPGDRLSASIKVVSTKVVNNVRTVMLTRPLKGMTKKHYTFNTAAQSQINMISAVGFGQVFEHHKLHGSTVMPLLDYSDSNCLCDMGYEGQLCEANGTDCITFVKNCVPAPAGDLLSQRNPTCNAAQYAGGLRCCKHKRIMLDADQEIRPELLRYHMKFRFWYQTYEVDNGKPSHNDLPRIYYQTEAWAGEYDIPPAFARKPIPGYPNWPANKPTPGTTCTGNCPDGDDCECIHTITYRWTVSKMRLIYAGGHCHAPACLSLALYRNDTDHEMELLCQQTPVYGKGNVTHDKYDEAGYIALPPCLWGNDKGLNPSVLLPANTPLVSIKSNRNTHVGHYGDMASWQMRGVFF